MLDENLLKFQNNKIALTTPNCLSLRNNAALLHSYLRHLRYLRENIHIRLLKQSAQKKPKSLSQIPLIYADKQQNLNSNTNYLSLLNNAACCIPLRYLRYLQENNTFEYSINAKKPQYSPSDFIFFSYEATAIFQTTDIHLVTYSQHHFISFG